LLGYYYVSAAQTYNWITYSVKTNPLTRTAPEPSKTQTTQTTITWALTPTIQVPDIHTGTIIIIVGITATAIAIIAVILVAILLLKQKRK
jgi:hypothetical protein